MYTSSNMIALIHNLPDEILSEIFLWNQECSNRFQFSQLEFSCIFNSDYTPNCEIV